MGSLELQKLKGISDRLEVVDTVVDSLQTGKDEIISSLDHHEHVWPASDGEGIGGFPVLISTDDRDETHGGATTQNYWGRSYAVITPADIATAYSWIGFYLYGDTTGKDFQWQAFRVVHSTLQTRNGGAAWDEGVTVLTVPDASGYVIGDQVWVRTPGYEPDGEILNVTNVVGNVITIARETSQFGVPNTGLKFNHTTNDAGNEEIYRINRATEGLRDTAGSFAVASAKDLMRYAFHAHRSVLANDGVIMRMLNESDGISSVMEVKAIYEDVIT